MKIKITEILSGVKCDIGAPYPKIIADESSVVLFFNLEMENSDLDAKNIYIKNNDDLRIIKFIFTQYEQFKFGSPNDEAISGHPYNKFGLEPYSISLVENSDWIKYLEKQNSVHPYHSKIRFEELNHYIFFFHDSCFEIVCKNYSFEIIKKRKQKEIIFEEIQNLFY